MLEAVSQVCEENVQVLVNNIEAFAIWTFLIRFMLYIIFFNLLKYNCITSPFPFLLPAPRKFLSNSFHTQTGSCFFQGRRCSVQLSTLHVPAEQSTVITGSVKRASPDGSCRTLKERKEFIPGVQGPSILRNLIMSHSNRP